MAEHAVQVNALQSQLNAGTPITAHYRWDFGDPAGEYNVLPGWNAGHVYDQPGTYTVTLAITNEAGKTGTATTTVTVLPDTRRTVYVDAAAGADKNAGLSPEQAVRTPGRAQQLLKAGTRLLFHRGQSFDVINWINVHDANVYVGAYGTADDGSNANPVLSVHDQTGIYTTTKSVGAVIEGLTFDSPYAPAGNVANKTPAYAALSVGGTNTLVRHCTFLNVNDAINTNPNPTGVIATRQRLPLPHRPARLLLLGAGERRRPARQPRRQLRPRAQRPPQRHDARPDRLQRPDEPRPLEGR